MKDRIDKVKTDETEDFLMAKLRENFSDELPPEIQCGLQQARHNALDNLDKTSRSWSHWMAPAIGTAAAVAVGATLFMESQSQPEFGELIVQAQELDLSDYVSLSELEEQDAELLHASLDQEVNLEFYAWLELQPEFME